MKYLNEKKYKKVCEHNGVDICTLKVAIPANGDELGYVIDDMRFDGQVFAHPENAAEKIDEIN